MQRIHKKLHSQTGETITEVLVAVLVIVLGLTMLAAMINSSSKLMTVSKRYYENYYNAVNALEEQTGKPEAATVVFTFKGTGFTPKTQQDEVNVKLYSSEENMDSDSGEKRNFTFYRYVFESVKK